ncbi:division/cell wall cluster transcriptional repressor MraZ, partial [Escherichia coli]
MFRGATLVNLDSKGRLSVPTRYREQLLENAAGQMVCTIDIHHPCLLLYPLPEWEIIEQKLSRLSSMNPVERRVQRLLLGHASECQMDGAGRLLIAPVLRQHAGLTKEVMLIENRINIELCPGIVEIDFNQHNLFPTIESLSQRKIRYSES